MQRANGRRRLRVGAGRSRLGAAGAGPVRDPAAAILEQRLGRANQHHSQYQNRRPLGPQPQPRTAAVSPVAVLPAARHGPAQPESSALLSLSADPAARHQPGLSRRPRAGALRRTAHRQRRPRRRPAAVQHGHGRHADRSRGQPRLEEGRRSRVGLDSHPGLPRLSASPGATAAQPVTQERRLHRPDRRIRRASAGDVQPAVRHQAREQPGRRGRHYFRQDDARDGLDAPVRFLRHGPRLQQHRFRQADQSQGSDRANDQGSGRRPLVEADV